MKILYTSDLHGRIKAYESVLTRAKAAGVRAIINGGDIYPLGRDLFQVQRSFLTGFFTDYLERCYHEGITYLATLGNMDLKGLDNIFRRTVKQASSAFSLLEEMVTFNGYTCVGSAMTIDGPFSLKDRCLRDTPDSIVPQTLGPALMSDASGIYQVPDWQQRVRELPALTEHLSRLPRPKEPEKTIYVLHQPPHGVNQGIISSGADVGSRAVADFLAQSRALLGLHGHIHESPFVGGSWRSKIGCTTCLQPGQLSDDRCVTVVIDLETLQAERDC
ncbi:MAG TPA: metallophosphoesterase [archaeon]|nr:metallophosphoesterase [archaeon]